ncbi:Disease resistance protein RPS4B [Cardamine amara subsp. amara]|uniref:Disease resistance protein RPS4B n=1 Tax=Cardamine amara subsp. amara TaxID=228776 RepID=A0ABD1BMP1_CARAN
MAAGSSTIKQLPPQHQVFINFCWEDFHYGFISHLVTALTSNNINVFTDNIKVQLKLNMIDESRKKREDSRIALVIFSEKYTESRWLLRELTMIADCVEKGKLVAIPIFYKLDPSTVKGLKGQFGDAFRYLRENDATKEMWKKALKSISEEMGIIVDQNSDETEILETTVVEVKRVLAQISSEGSQKAYVDSSENIDTSTSAGSEKDKTFGIKQRMKELEDKLDLNKITSQLGMIIACLLLLLFCLQQVAYMSTLLRSEGDVIDRIVENIPKMLQYIPAYTTENPRDKNTEVPTDKYGAKPERSSSDAKANADFLDRTFTNSPMDGKVKPPNIQVFINFRGDQLRNNFIGFLVDALRRSEINVFIDNQEQRGEDLNTLFKRIEDSGIAIVVFSSRYTESKWCLEELVKIKERVHQGLLKVLPIYYKVTPTNVKRLKGEFGDHFRDKEYMYGSDEPKIKRWKEAIVFVSQKFALTFDEKSNESEFVRIIFKEVKKVLRLQGSSALFHFQE